MTIRPVPLEQAYRLLNHGPTTLVSAKHNTIENVMAASWISTLDLFPMKITAVLDQRSFTRTLIEQNGWFALQLPVAAQADAVVALGTQSYRDNPHKLADSNIELFYQQGFALPLIKGCAAWLICRLLPELNKPQTYNLLIGEVISAWADDRIFLDGHWNFDNVDDRMKTLHYVSGGQFYLTGQGLIVQGGP